MENSTDCNSCDLECNHPCNFITPCKFSSAFCICDYNRITVEQHTPWMVCCTAIKTWALFFMDIVESIKNWEKWIVQTFHAIEEMIRLGADKWEWICFLKIFNADISRWLSYKRHLDDIATNTALYFKNKRVECCTLCLKDYIQYENLGVDHLCPELIEAMDAAPHWKQLLCEMVIECEFQKIHGNSAFWQKFPSGDCCKRSYQKFPDTHYKNKFQIQSTCLRDRRQELCSRNILLRKNNSTANPNMLSRRLSELILNSKRSSYNSSFCKKVKTYHKPCAQRLLKLAVPKRRIRENYSNHRSCMTLMQLETLYNLLMPDQRHKIPFKCPSIQVETTDCLENNPYKYRSKCYPNKSKILTIQRDSDKIKVVEESKKKSIKILPKPKCYPYSFKQIKHSSKSVYKEQGTQTIEVKEIKIVEVDKKVKPLKPQKQKTKTNDIKQEPASGIDDDKRESFHEIILEKLDFTETKCQLLSILKHYNWSMGGEVKVFSENEFLDFTLHTLVEKLEEILISMTKFDKMQQIIYDKIFNYIQAVSPESWDTKMNDFVCCISKKLANKIGDNYKIPSQEIPCKDLSCNLSQCVRKVLSCVKNSSNTSRSICENHNDLCQMRNSNNSQNKCILAQHSDNIMVTSYGYNNLGIPPWMKSIVPCLTEALETLDIEVSKIYDENEYQTDDEPKSVIHHCACDTNDPSTLQLTNINLERRNCSESSYTNTNGSAVCSCVDWSSSCVPKKTPTKRGGSDSLQRVGKLKKKTYSKYEFLKRYTEVWHSTNHQATNINKIQQQSNESDEIMSPKASLQEKISSIPEDIFDERYLLAKKFTLKNKESQSPYYRIENRSNVCNDLINLDAISNATINLIKMDNLIQFDNSNTSNSFKQQSNEMLQKKVTANYNSTSTNKLSFSEIITKESNIHKKYLESCVKSSSSSTSDEPDFSLSAKDTNSPSNSDVTISLPKKYTQQLLLHNINNRKLRKNIFETHTISDGDKCNNVNKKCKCGRIKEFNKKDNVISNEKRKSEVSIDKKTPSSKDHKNRTPPLTKRNLGQLNKVKSNSKTNSSNRHLNNRNDTRFDEELKLINEIHTAIQPLKVKGMISNSKSSTTMENDIKSLQLSNIILEHTVLQVINTEQQDKKYEIELYPHGFEVVCLESLKSWVMFIKEVTNHTMQWCCWINRNLKKILFTSSIIKSLYISFFKLTV